MPNTLWSYIWIACSTYILLTSHLARSLKIFWFFFKNLEKIRWLRKTFLEFFQNYFRIILELLFLAIVLEFEQKYAKLIVQSVQHLLPLHHQNMLFRHKTWRLKMTKVSATLVRHIPKKVLYVPQSKYPVLHLETLM